jgi:hypothetical protein
MTMTTWEKAKVLIDDGAECAGTPEAIKQLADLYDMLSELGRREGMRGVWRRQAAALDEIYGNRGK